MSNASVGGNGQAPASDPSTTANGQAPAQSTTNNTASTPPVASGTNGQAPASTQDNNAATLSAEDIKRLQQELAEARRDAAKYRNENKTLTDAQLTEQQKRDRDFEELKAGHATATQENQRLRLQLAGFRIAPTLGITDIPAALALVQVEHAGDLKYDDKTNEPSNLDALLKRVIEAHPFLAAQTPVQPAEPQQPQRAPVQTGGAMNPGRAGAPVQQSVPNRPLRTFNDVQWKTN